MAAEDEAGNNDDGESKPKHRRRWTPSEDEILKDYVKNNGERNWNAVPKKTGLNRDGKNCRNRWMRHLRPNFKKGSFTDEESKTIQSLHNSWGNKWAKIAEELPGRTEQEIRNHWTLKIRKEQRIRHGVKNTFNSNQQLRHLRNQSRRLPRQNTRDVGYRGSTGFPYACPPEYDEHTRVFFPLQPENWQRNTTLTDNVDGLLPENASGAGFTCPTVARPQEAETSTSAPTNPNQVLSQSAQLDQREHQMPTTRNNSDTDVTENNPNFQKK